MGTAGSPSSQLPGAGAVGRRARKSLNLKNNNIPPPKKRAEKPKPRPTKRQALPPGSARAAGFPLAPGAAAGPSPGPVSPLPG